MEYARATGILRLLENFSNVEAKKLCICVNCAFTIKLISRLLPEYNANGYRATHSGNVLENKETYASLYKIIRERPDLTILMSYLPADINTGMKEAQKLAKFASMK